MADEEDFIRLEVGGKIYDTSRSTLSQCPYFEGAPSQNFYEIDRDGEMFRHVLNFLRYEKLMLPESFADFELLQAEADFFQMGELSNALRDKTGNPQPQAQVIGLNVGGKVYWVSKDIFKRYPNSVFEDILHSRFEKDDKGNCHIDQDGEVFQYVLNFLRSGNLGLPEGFDEFELLKQQAEFLKLKELEQLVKFEEMTRRRRVKTVGFVINGQVFKLRREDVLRETWSDFAKIVRGDRPAPTDAEGNVIIEKPAENASNLMHYISHGGIFKTMTSKEVEQLKEDASRFRVSKSVLPTHFDTIQFMTRRTTEFHLRVIHFLDHPTCNIAYANKKPPDYFFGKALEIYKIQVGDEAVCVGKINIEELKRKDEELKSVEAADIASSICRITSLEGTPVFHSYDEDELRMCHEPRHTVLGFSKGYLTWFIHKR